MSDGGYAYRVPDSEWAPPAWVLGASSAVRFVLGFGGVVVLFAGCGILTRGWWGFPLGVCLLFLSILLHEAGHAIAAVVGGATVVRVQVGRLDVQPLRDGWRVRWKRGLHGIGGMVQSFPSPHRSLRRQFVAIVAAGPLTNAVLALAALGLAYGFRDQYVGAALLGFSIFNACTTLGNLLPWSSATTLASDGLQLWRWARGIGDDDPQVAFTMLNARLISGEPFGAWADEYLRILERSSQPGPMFVLWVRIKQLQLDGEWARVDEVMRQVELNIVGLSPPMAKAMEGFIAVLRCEAAFSRAMAGEVPMPSPVEALGRDMGWLFPALRTRCEALQCAIDGQADEARARLAESAVWSKRSVDRSLDSSETVLRDAIAARIDGLHTPPMPAVPVPLEA